MLLCPADELGGKAIFQSNIDPKMPVSYGYQFHPEYRAGKTEERLMYGDVLPLVRCRHHVDQAFECLNLSFAFKIYGSSGVYTPIEMFGTPEKAIEALEAGLQRQPDDKRFFDLYFSLVRLYIEVGRKKDADNLINRFKSNMKPDDLQAHFLLSRMLEIADRSEEVLAVFEKLENWLRTVTMSLANLREFMRSLAIPNSQKNIEKRRIPCQNWLGRLCRTFPQLTLMENRFHFSNIKESCLT